MRRHREMARLEREMLESVTALAQQLEQTAFRINEKIQDRIRTLEELLRTADERIAQLALNEPLMPSASQAAPDTNSCQAERLLSDDTPSDVATLALDAAPSADSNSVPEGVELVLSDAQIIETVTPHTCQRIMSTATADANHVALVDAPSPPKPASLENNQQTTFDDARTRILQLSARNMRPIDIAESLGLALGEVELVLNLEQFAVAKG